MKSQKIIGFIKSLGLLSFPKRKNADAAITVIANPGFQFIIIFKNIHSYRVPLAGKRNYFRIRYHLF